MLLLGTVSLFGDMTYESARSISGPFLALLGASATTVGVAAGLGELLGYALRLVSGNLVDRTRRYWSIALTGYALNLLAVPLLALAGSWQLAVGLLFIERAGRAIRVSPRDAMLSFAGRRMGKGWGFALHEAMDQGGAMLGPLAVAALLAWRHDYRLGFAVLLLPALLSLGVLLLARALYPNPAALEPAGLALGARGFDRVYWRYLIAAGCIAAGFADYPLIAFHLGKSGGVGGEWIAMFYAIAMGVDGLAALLLGYGYDRHGLSVLVLAAVLAMPVAPLVFWGGFGASLAGAILWGLGMGAQESIMKATIAAMSPAEQRGRAFGVYHLAFGVFWFAGSALMGWLYDVSLTALVVFSVALQGLAAVQLFTLIGPIDRYLLPATPPDGRA
ncbi:MFS transporter [Crenobacter luteus]|uniref:MFS transporter n=1 Tax=Crenobacter luteus TaxID=1452487 RepID=A0A161SI75_9NEIS|nr:MFS transporter [Crenobacter luteus]KZE33550.1 MFS transporter [Crenobacter luteus]